MKLTITLRQFGKKPKTVTTTLSDAVATLETLRKLWDAEQVLNSLPGSDLRVHISVLEEAS